MPSRDELRKVKTTRQPDGSGPFVTNGYFHAWGNYAYPTDNGGDFPVIKAIVELESGEVKRMEPNCIKFVDEF